MKGEDAAKTSHYTGPIKCDDRARSLSLLARASIHDLPAAEAPSASSVSRGQRLALQHRSHRPLALAAGEAGRLVGSSFVRAHGATLSCLGLGCQVVPEGRREPYRRNRGLCKWPSQEQLPLQRPCFPIEQATVSEPGYGQLVIIPQVPPSKKIGTPTSQTERDCNLSENTTSCQNGIVSQRTNASAAAWDGFRAAI